MFHRLSIDDDGRNAGEICCATMLPMKFYRTVGAALGDYPQEVAKFVENAVRDLLQNKHLYQSSTIDTAAIANNFLRRVEGNAVDQVKRGLSDAKFLPWAVQDSENIQAMIASLRPGTEGAYVLWRAPDVKLFCKRCDRREPFNSVSSSNLLERSDPGKGGVRFKNSIHQVFTLSYLCQSCKAVPEVFLVQRIDAKLTLAGRSPMEQVEVSPTIHRAVSKYYSGAVIAFQSGQTLAALFLFRTLCEQWCRQFAVAEEKADQAIEKYMISLPQDFKARFPSLRDLYSDLSVALHTADANDDLYERVRMGLREHFDARTLFKLENPPAIVGSSLPQASPDQGR